MLPSPEKSAPVSDPGPTSPLQNTQYRDLWTANSASNFGTQVQIVGATWLMSSLTASPQMIAFVQGAQNLGTVFVILMGGALADNYDRRRIMMATQSLMLVFASTLAFLTWNGQITPWILLAITLAISALGSINNPAWQASVRDLLPRSLISRAVALNSMSINLARTAGPALGGAVVSVAGSAAAFLVNALSFVGFLIALFRWKRPSTSRTSPRETIVRSMHNGLIYVTQTPGVRNATIRGGMSGFAASAVFALLPVVAGHTMKGNAIMLGALLAAFGLGAVLSAYAGGRLRGFCKPDTVVRIAAVGLISGPLLLGIASTMWIAGLGAALGGAGWTLTHSTYNTTVQMSAAQSVTARALATYQTATFAGMAIGSGIFGWIAEHEGVSVALLTASAAQLVAAALGTLLPLPKNIGAA